MVEVSRLRGNIPQPEIKKYEIRVIKNKKYLLNFYDFCPISFLLKNGQNSRERPLMTFDFRVGMDIDVVG